tara:strand:- start:49 stop:339 length:291 start_codon:yes stop_codon:yes gene_type:complete
MAERCFFKKLKVRLQAPWQLVIDADNIPRIAARDNRRQRRHANARYVLFETRARRSLDFVFLRHLAPTFLWGQLSVTLNAIPKQKNLHSEWPFGRI